MMNLRTSELRAALAYADEALTVMDFRHLDQMLAMLTRLVGADRTTLTHLDQVTHREVAVFWPEPPSPDVLQGYATHGASHPLRGPVAALARRPSTSHTPVRISDLLSRRQWRATPLYRDALTDVDDQMTLPLAVRGSAVHAVTLTRSAGVFTDRQRDLLSSCARHLAAALARARRHENTALQISPVARWVSALDVPGLPGAPTPGDRSLSTREREVLALVATGLTDAQVATRLNIRATTVSKQLNHIYTRLGLPNRTAAVVHWQQQPAW